MTNSWNAKKLVSTILAALFLLAGLSMIAAFMLSKGPKTITASGDFTVSRVRVKGFDIAWPAPKERGSFEFAIAAGTAEELADYETASSSGVLCMDWTEGSELKNPDGSYSTRITGVRGARDKYIAIFAKGTRAKETIYLKSTDPVVLPYIDDSLLMSISVNGVKGTIDEATDDVSVTFLPGVELSELTIQFTTTANSTVFLNDKPINKGDKVSINSIDDALLITTQSNRSGGARDYQLKLGYIDNGIPTVLINVENNEFPDNKEKEYKATMQIFDSKSSPYGVGLYKGDIILKGRGNSSWDMPKKSYNIKLAEKSEILDMPSSPDWFIQANFSDKTLMRNFTAYELSRDMGRYSANLRFVDVVLNGSYVGTYNIGERLKIEKDRISLDKLTKEDISEDKISGGYLVELNSTDKWAQDEIIFETKRININNGHFFSIKQPGESNLSEEHIEYLKDYFNRLEDTLYGDDFLDPEKGYKTLIDIDSVIDWYLVNEIYKNCDATFHTSVYFYKPRNDKLHMGPVWDFDIGAGNINYNGCDDPTGWWIRDTLWISRMFEDPEFESAVKARWKEIYADQIPKLFERIDKTAKLLESSQNENFKVWPILGQYTWPNADGFAERTTYESEVDYLKSWLEVRIGWLNNHFEE
ncbi:MAG: CotH kinase family protein [Eubacteriales bacterium]